MDFVKRISTFILGLIAIVMDIYLIVAVWYVAFWQFLIVEGLFIIAGLLFYVALEGF